VECDIAGCSHPVRDGPLFFWRGGWKILKKIVCKDKKVQINCLQANEISMQHQPMFNNNEQSASTNIQKPSDGRRWAHVVIYIGVKY
jgi:hypothetical protein